MGFGVKSIANKPINGKAVWLQPPNKMREYSGGDSPPLYSFIEKDTHME